MPNPPPVRHSPAGTGGDCGGAAGTAVLDEAALQKLRDLDPNGRSRVLQRVLEAYDSTLTRLLDQLGPVDGPIEPETVRHVVHTLKSSSASIGALEFARRCVEVESRLRAQQTDGLPALLAGLRAEGERVRRAVQAMLAS